MCFALGLKQKKQCCEFKLCVLRFLGVYSGRLVSLGTQTVLSIYIKCLASGLLEKAVFTSNLTSAKVKVRSLLLLE